MIWKELLGAIIRWAVTLVLGWLTLKRVITDEEASTWNPKLVAEVLGLLTTLGLSLWQKYRARLFAAIAKEMPANVSTGRVKREMKALPVKEAVKKAFTQ